MNYPNMEATLKRTTLIDDDKRYRIYWPSTGTIIFIPAFNLNRRHDGCYEYHHDDRTFEVEGIPTPWDGKEIAITIEPVEPPSWRLDLRKGR